MNRRLVLQTVLSSGEASRADIARETALAPPSVSELVVELLDDGLLEVAGTGVSSGGKRPTMLRFRADGRQLIAIDLSQSRFQGYRTDLAGNVLQREVVATDDGGDAAVDATLRLATSLVERSDAPLLGLAVGTPGRVTESGVVLESANLGWSDVPLGDLLHERTGQAVHIGNDVQVSALDEYGRDGALTNLVLVRIGTGIGAGIILNGHLHRGDGGAAGEIGHVQVRADGRRCTCGRVGCLETVATVPSILRAAGLDPRSDLSELDATIPALAAAVETAAEHLANVLAPVLLGLDVQNLVVGGAAEQLGPDLLESLRGAIARRIPGSLRDGLTIRVSTAGDDAVLAGAWTLLLSRELGVMRQ